MAGNNNNIEDNVYEMLSTCVRHSLYIMLCYTTCCDVFGSITIMSRVVSTTSKTIVAVCPQWSLRTCKAAVNHPNERPLFGHVVQQCTVVGQYRTSASIAAEWNGLDRSVCHSANTDTVYPPVISMIIFHRYLHCCKRSKILQTCRHSALDALATIR